MGDVVLSIKAHGLVALVRDIAMKMSPGRIIMTKTSQVGVVQAVATIAKH
jgi:hypothetical protein